MNDNKRIVVNTGILYGKLVITTIIGLLSSRYILLSLGSSDFGLYSVVGGIVTFLNVIGVTMKLIIMIEFAMDVIWMMNLFNAGV